MPKPKLFCHSKSKLLAPSLADVALLIADVPEYQTNPAERRLMTFPEAATLLDAIIAPTEDAFCMYSISPRGSGRSQLRIPTAAEFRLLEILWRIGGERTIEDLLQASDKNNPLNYKTVQTVLRVMETKKFVSHSVRGRAFVYQPRVKHHEIRRISLRSLLEKYFRGSRSELLVNLLEDERIEIDELRELENLVRSHRKARASVRKNHR